MAFISETLQMRRLTESGVNIKTTYIVDGTLRYRSTDANLQDDVHSGIPVSYTHLDVYKRQKQYSLK